MGTVDQGKHYKAAFQCFKHGILLYGTTSLYKWAGLFDISQQDQNQKHSLLGTNKRKCVSQTQIFPLKSSCPHWYIAAGGAFHTFQTLLIGILKLTFIIITQALTVALKVPSKFIIFIS